MMLLIDIGNSRTKWAYVEHGVWTRQGAVDNAGFSGLHAELSALPGVRRILVSNVAGEAMAEIVRDLRTRWDEQVEFIASQPRQCGVVNGYENPSQLGCDRWAALIGAWHRQHDACLVVNCGTAITIDALSPHGEFLGGLILPGLNLLRQSLVHNTVQLRMESGKVCDFPRNTADAMASGAIRATVGAILGQRERLGEVPCLLSGGAAEALLPYLGPSATLVDNLVLYGLQIIGESEQC